MLLLYIFTNQGEGREVVLKHRQYICMSMVEMIEVDKFINEDMYRSGKKNSDQIMIAHFTKSGTGPWLSHTYCIW